MKNQKDDQLVIPISLPEGMALRAVAEKYDSLAALVRLLVRRGLSASPEIQSAYEQKLVEFSKLTTLQLLQAKQKPSKYGQPKL